MNSFNLKQAIALLGAASASALLGLPVLAQSSGSPVLSPNQAVPNEAPSNRTPSNGTPDRCAAYVNGGIGGPVNNSSTTGDNSSASQSTQSNSAGMASGSTDNSMRGEYRQFSGDNPSAAVAYRANGPAGTSGREATMNIDANLNRDQNSGSVSNLMRSTSGNSLRSASTGNSMQGEYRQFSGDNPSAAVAYRANGPAGTSGREATMNIDANLRRDRNLNAMNNSSMTNNSSMSTNSMSNQAAATIPAECLPR